MNHFSENEIKCKCGKCDGRLDLLDKDFLNKLNLYREKIGRPLTVTSFIRCPLHPVEAKKTLKGAHTKGCAVDLFCSTSSDRFQMLKLAFDMGFTRIGYADNFIHLDTIDSPAFPKNVMWRY